MVKALFQPSAHYSAPNDVKSARHGRQTASEEAEQHLVRCWRIRRWRTHQGAMEEFNQLFRTRTNSSKVFLFGSLMKADQTVVLGEVREEVNTT